MSAYGNLLVLVLKEGTSILLSGVVLLALNSVLAVDISTLRHYQEMSGYTVLTDRHLTELGEYFK